MNIDLKKFLEELELIICSNCIPSFDYNRKPVCVFDAVNGYSAIEKHFSKLLSNYKFKSVSVDNKKRSFSLQISFIDESNIDDV